MDRVVAWLFVIAQGVFIAAVVLLPGGDWQVTALMQAGAWSLIAVAAALGLWAARWLGRGLTPLPLPNGLVGLVTRGPYRWIRHPMYTAVTVGMGGIALRSGSRPAVVALVLLGVLFSFKARWEERRLLAAFAGYDDYAARTGRFIPGVGR